MSLGRRFPVWIFSFVVIALFPALTRAADADYGDAPASYGSASAGDGSHEWLGAAWDAESLPQYSTNARGDDILGINDEDGVQLVWDSGSNTWAFDVTVSVADRNAVSGFQYRYQYGGSLGGGTLLYLRGWWDSNGDGVFTPGTEQILFGQFNPQVEWTSNSQTYHYLVPGFSPEQSGDYFRFRLSYGGPSALALGPLGFASYGEVTDILVTPEPTTMVLLGGAVLMLVRRRRRNKLA